jgi:hypothetical protein
VRPPLKKKDVDEVTWGHKNRALIQFDWCLQVKERGLGRNKPCWRNDFELQPPVLLVFDKQNPDSYLLCGRIQAGYVDIARVVIKVD